MTKWPSRCKHGATQRQGSWKAVGDNNTNGCTFVPTPTIRRPFQVCCADDFELGQPTNSSRGCEVVMGSDDLTTTAGLQTALRYVSDPSGGLLLWASMLCTGWSAQQHINKQHSNGRVFIKKHMALFALIWAAFETVARRCWQDVGWPR